LKWRPFLGTSILASYAEDRDIILVSPWRKDWVEETVLRPEPVELADGRLQVVIIPAHAITQEFSESQVMRESEMRLLIGAGVAALVAATFLPQVQDYRAEKADAAIAQGDWKAAKQLSFLGKLQGDQKAANNYHVLNYKLMREEAQAMRKAADSGNGLAAYRYANSLRFKPKQLARAEKYALMGAEAGYADAQAFLGIYFPRRTDAEDWLKKAATNPENRNMRAPLELAEIAKKRRKSKERRDWLTLGMPIFF